MSIEIRSSIAEQQALNMAHYTGIELLPEQIDYYVQFRQGIKNHETNGKPSIQSNLSDQKLFYEFLNEKQRVIFELRYPQIFSDQIDRHGEFRQDIKNHETIGKPPIPFDLSYQELLCIFLNESKE